MSVRHVTLVADKNPDNLHFIRAIWLMIYPNCSIKKKSPSNYYACEKGPGLVMAGILEAVMPDMRPKIWVDEERAWPVVPEGTA